MFPQLTGPQNVWLTLLLSLWAALLFGGFIFGKLDSLRIRRMPAWTRMASSLTLVVAAWSWYAFTRESGVSVLALPTAIGMTLGFIGDLFMAQLLPVGSHYVLGGIGAFSLGHMAYITGMVQFGDAYGLNTSGPRWGALLTWLLVGTACWYGVVFRGGERSALHIAALPYTLLLCGAAGLATGLALQQPAFVGLAAGTALFVLSDLILAARLFNKLHFYLIDDVVWLTYGPAQMLIVYSLSVALGMAGR
jgi:hypothetical protein